MSPACSLLRRKSCRNCLYTYFAIESMWQRGKAPIKRPRVARRRTNNDWNCELSNRQAQELDCTRYFVNNCAVNCLSLGVCLSISGRQKYAHKRHAPCPCIASRVVIVHHSTLNSLASRNLSPQFRIEQQCLSSRPNYPQHERNKGKAGEGHGPSSCRPPGRSAAGMDNLQLLLRARAML